MEICILHKYVFVILDNIPYWKIKIIVISYKHKEVIPITGNSLKAPNQMHHQRQEKAESKRQNLSEQDIDQDTKAIEKSVSADFDS